MKIGKITTTNQKGQIVIPKKLREALQITNKVPLNLVLKDGGIYIHPISEVITPAEKESTLEILKKTQGAWKDADWDDWDKKEKKRRKIELAATRRNKKAW